MEMPSTICWSDRPDKSFREMTLVDVEDRSSDKIMNVLKHNAIAAVMMKASKIYSCQL